MADLSAPSNARRSTARSAPARIPALDLARGAALLAMAVFHFVFDLEMFGFVEPGTAMRPGWRWLAFLTAGSFLFLVGVSLWLAHGRGIRWHSFWRRLAMVGAAAAAITLATYIAMPGAYIFFGILHAIAVSSLLGLLVLHLPGLLLVGLGAFCLWLPNAMRFDMFNPPWLWWIGLQDTPVRAVDYVPILPWFGPVLFGIALSKWADRTGLWQKVSTRATPSPLLHRLGWPGRNSLLVYLIHQPILIALVWMAAQLR